ncbi:hypothetical protein [Candidatus Poriferisodalis sp.]|uniref:hypothetical protein n=1 Tax=Candidatus Poriferisodalis sp. TaxID=3101277 RepID=UPI003B530180
MSADLTHDMAMARLGESESDLGKLGGLALLDEISEVCRDSDEEVVVVCLELTE